MLNPGPNIKKILITQIVIYIVLFAGFFGTLYFIRNPSDYLPEKIARVDRRSLLYGYTFLPWEELMPNNTLATDYLNLAAQALNCCYVNVQWSYASLDNHTLNLNYLNNLSLYLDGLRNRSMTAVIYTWCAHYYPKWLFPFVPVVVNADKHGSNWNGIDPLTQNASLLIQRSILKSSYLHFYNLLCDYFVMKGFQTTILGFNLDDEPDTTNWNDFYTEITTLVHNKYNKWQTQVMWLNPHRYAITSEVGLDVQAFDAYCQDFEFIQRITHAYDTSGNRPVSVLMSAMFDHDDYASMQQLRRQSWIAWFMGCDSYGFYSFYYGDPEWSCAIMRLDDGLGPEITEKTYLILNITQDIWLLNRAYQRIGEESDGKYQEYLESKLLDGYRFAKASEFDEALLYIKDVINS